MLSQIARRLAEHAEWPQATQHAMVDHPATKAALLHNPRLSLDVVDRLLAGCSEDDLRLLIQFRRHGLDGLRACLRRAHELFPYAYYDREELDFELAWNLLHGEDGPERVRAIDAELAGLPWGGSLASVRYAAGVDAPVVEIVSGLDAPERARWLLTPAAAAVSDEDAWNLLGPTRREGTSSESSRNRIASIAAVMLVRPQLRDRGRDYAVRPDARGTAAEALDLVDMNADLAKAPPQGKFAVFAERLARARDEFPELAHEAFAIATIEDWSTWPTDQIDMLEASAHMDTFAETLSWLAPVVAARIRPRVGFSRNPRPMGFDGVEVPRRHALEHSWEGIKTLSPEIVQEPVADPASMAVNRITPETAEAPTKWLEHQLEHEDPRVVAERWKVVFRTIDTFTGTVADLASVATAITTPANA